MKLHTTASNKVASYLICIVLALVPFHGFITVWGSTFFGHYTLLRLWDDALLLTVFALACWWLVRDRVLRKWFFESLLVRLIAAYVVLTVLLAAVAYAKDDVSLKALFYGLLINLRFFAWFLTVLLASQRSVVLAKLSPRLLLVPASIVICFGALQYAVLPHDFLRHFGYDAKTTIAPIGTINHNADYIRVQSTLRGVNALGAYLVVVLAALGTALLVGKRRILIGLLGLVGLFTLYASGSRSAWIATVISLAVVAALRVKSGRARLILAGVASSVLLIAAVGFVVFKNDAGLQNAVLHTQDNSKVAVSSNDAHLSSVQTNIQDVLQQPLGDGPGTAGPASEYNTKQPARIAENYYVQVAQETGWLGLVLFVTIVVLIGIELYQRARTSWLALALLASLVGLAIVNMLSHAWADDTLAFVWWGFAAIALGAAKTTKGKL